MLTFGQKIETVWVRDVINSKNTQDYRNTKALRIARNLFDREKKKGYSSDDLQILLNTIRHNPEIKEPLWIKGFTDIDDHPIYGDGLTKHQRLSKKGQSWWWKEEHFKVIIDSYSVNGYAYLRGRGFEFLSEEYDIIFTKTE